MREEGGDAGTAGPELLGQRSRPGGILEHVRVLVAAAADEAGRGGLKFYAWLVLSALTTALALCTKLMIAVPLIIFIPAYLFLYSDENVKLSINKRLKYFLYFLLSLIFFTIIMTFAATSPPLVTVSRIDASYSKFAARVL